MDDVGGERARALRTANARTILRTDVHWNRVPGGDYPATLGRNNIDLCRFALRARSHRHEFALPLVGRAHPLVRLQLRKFKAVTAGNSLPSRNSRNAPPPVEM
jgi:hypothetical protein